MDRLFTIMPPHQPMSSLPRSAIQVLIRQEQENGGTELTYWRLHGGSTRRITVRGPEGLPPPTRRPVPGPSFEDGCRPTEQHTVVCGPHPMRRLPAAPLLCNENHQRFYELVASYTDSPPGSPSTSGDEEQEQPHTGLVHPCSNTAEHLEEPGGQHFVCSACIFDTYVYLLQHRRKLLRPAFLPICTWCAIERLSNEEIVYGYDGCVCPRQPGRGVWLCFECRYKELNLVRLKKEVEEEWRRGVVGVGVMDGVIETALVGMTCWCGKPLEMGVGGAERCAGCLGLFRKAIGR